MTASAATAPLADAAPWHLPARLLPYLEPGRAVSELARRLPALEITGFTADRIEPGADAVALDGVLHLIDLGRPRPCFVSIRAHSDGGENVWISPADPALPQLPAILKRPPIEHATSASGLREVPREVHVFAHRFGRRACFRVDLSASRYHGRVYARQTDDALAAVLGLLASHRERIRATVPQVIFHDRGRRFVTLTWVDGIPLHEKQGAPPILAAAAAGSAVRAWQRVPADGLPRHGTSEELERIRRLVGRIAMVRPSLVPRFEAAISAVTASAASRPDGRPVLAHRNLHDKQVLLRSSGIGIVDWERASASPAALDPANFLAHLRLRVLQHRLPPWHARVLRGAFLAGYVAEGAGQPECLSRWEQLALLRLAAAYALRPTWPRLAESLLEFVRV